MKKKKLDYFNSQTDRFTICASKLTSNVVKLVLLFQRRLTTADESSFILPLRKKEDSGVSFPTAPTSPQHT